MSHILTPVRCLLHPKCKFECLLWLEQGICKCTTKLCLVSWWHNGFEDKLSQVCRFHKATDLVCKLWLKLHNDNQILSWWTPGSSHAPWFVYGRLTKQMLTSSNDFFKPSLLLWGSFLTKHSVLWLWISLSWVPISKNCLHLRSICLIKSVQPPFRITQFSQNTQDTARYHCLDQH